MIDKYRTPPPKDCLTCKNRVSVELSACLGAAIYGNSCREFITDDPLTGESDNLPCGDAYDNFCGGSGYKPNLRSRLIRFFAMKQERLT